MINRELKSKLLSALQQMPVVALLGSRHYLDILTDFYMVRQIQPWSGNTKKRLIKSPKIYLRDSGILHSLLNISSFDSLLGNPVLGASWEGFVTENIILQLSSKWRYSYYRTSNQIEIDLVLESPENEIWAIEIKAQDLLF